jgi:hypothetical protein
VVEDGEPIPGGVIAPIAAGTGLEEGFLTWDGLRYHAHDSEGTHNDFGPTTPRETELLHHLTARWGCVSYEQVCARQSVPVLYDFLKTDGEIPESPALAAGLTTLSDHTPIWPNRDRFVLSAGHASMLLYRLLRLTGVKAVNPKYETLGTLSVHAGPHQALPPARQQVSRPP